VDTKFWSRLDDLINTSEIVIDRPKGTAHPKFPNLIFPLDYGYLKGTTTVDGGGIDLWIGNAPHRKLTAIGCTVDTKKKDAEIKLLIGCYEDDITTIEKFHNGVYMSAIIVRRGNHD
jgi:inorganic pyrophosphatase